MDATASLILLGRALQIQPSSPPRALKDSFGRFKVAILFHLGGLDLEPRV